MKFWKQCLSALLAALMLLAGPGGTLAEAAAAAQPEKLTLEAIEALGAKVYTHENRVTFVEGACTDAPVRSMQDAARVVNAMIPLTGGDERTQFEPWRSFRDPAGNVYWVFQQIYAETTVSGGAVKVVTDGDGRMLGLVASVESELPDVREAEGISAEKAEALVVSTVSEKEGRQVEVMEGRTTKIILPVNRDIDIESEEEKEESRFVWAVYTNNPNVSVIQGSDLPYLAHYVTMDGAYLYSLPTIMPGDEVGTTGYNAAYVFEFMEPVDYTGTVTLADGTEQEITVSLMRDARTGMYYLGNVQRRIAVADCYPFIYEKGHVQLEASSDNTGWDNTCLLALYNYCKAWDYYHEIGWTGGDGLGTPMLILKDYCNKDHIPVDNAAYAGRYYGWQVFLSSSVNDMAGCLDVLGHEFTHCVTGSMMTYNAYKNDYGAINEAMSDIQGNICEMMLGATADTQWEIGENGGGAVRSMSDPHQYGQPEYAWDIYYQSAVKIPTMVNDRGGVHSNSSLLNHVAYRLCTQGGMTFEEARVFWFAVDCAMVPGTDYAQLSELLPWVLTNVGMKKYQKALDAAMDATRLRTNVIPETFDENRAMVTLTLPDQERFTDGHWGLLIVSVDVERVVQRVNDIMEGKGEYAGALDELLIALGEKEEAPEEPETNGTLMETLQSLFGDAMDEEEMESEEPEESDIDGEKLREWYNRYFRELVYAGTGMAGQDGRTVRLVCQPGMTLPVLFRLEADNEGNIQSIGLAVYSFGSWYEIGTALAEILEEIPEEPVEEEEVDLAWLDELLGLDEDSGKGLEDPFMEMPAWLKTALDSLTQSSWIRNLLFFEIRPGAVCEIPAVGLEQVTSLSTEDYPVLKEIFSDIEETEQTGDGPAKPEKDRVRTGDGPAKPKKDRVL